MEITQTNYDKGKEHTEQWKGRTNIHTGQHTHTGLRSFVLLYPLLCHLQLFPPKRILKDSRTC